MLYIILEGFIVDKNQQFLELMKEDPMFFVEDILGKKMWSKQRKIVRSVNNFPRTTAKGCHGFGKTFTAGSIVLQFLFTYSPSIVLTTAPTFRQVEKLIWKEIRDSYSHAKIPLGGKLQDGAPLIQIIKDQWYAMGLSTQDGDRFQGFHEENILVVVDEAAGVPENIYTAIEGLLTSANAHLLLIGNPTSTSGTFKKSFEEQGWNKISVSAFDTPNFKYLGITEKDIANGKWQDKLDKKNGRIVFPKMVTPHWVADKYKRWGPSSVLYKTRVMGEFDEHGSDTIIPLSWIEAAKARWEDMEEEGPVHLGVDVAEFGRDSSNIYVKKGRKIMPAKTFNKIPIMQLTGHIMIIMNAVQAECVKIDTIGVGTGVEGRLDEMGVHTKRVNVAEAPGGDNDKEKAKFINKRAQLYWALREMLDPDPNNNPNPIGLPPDEELEEELIATKFKINSRGQIQILPKDEIKAILGRSPDKADALMIACAPLALLSNGKAIKSAGTW